MLFYQAEGVGGIRSRYLFFFQFCLLSYVFHENCWIAGWRGKGKFMRRPCGILNLRFHVRWAWEACTSFNLEWNCSNIHAIVYYECFFRTTLSFHCWQTKSCWQVYNFCRWFQSTVSHVKEKSFRWDSLFCMLLVVFETFIWLRSSTLTFESHCF